MLDLVCKLLCWRALGNYYSILLSVLLLFFPIFWCFLVRKTQELVFSQIYFILSITDSIDKESWIQCYSTIIYFNKINGDIQLIILCQKFLNQQELQINLKVLISSRLYPLTIPLVSRKGEICPLEDKS